MLEKIAKAQEHAKFALIICTVIKIAAAILTVLSIVLFDGHEFAITLMTPYYISIYMKSYAGPVGFWILLILSTLGWPVSIALIVNIEEKLWIPSAFLILLSSIDLCSHIAAVIISGTNFDLSIHPQLIISIIFNSVILLLSIFYLIICKKAQKTYSEN